VVSVIAATRTEQTAREMAVVWILKDHASGSQKSDDRNTKKKNIKILMHAAEGRLPFAERPM
jgi:hypothetical protein